MELTQSQIQALKNKGLDDAKIKALALQRGFSMPQQSTLGAIGSALVRSERGFGQSIAGAVGSTVLSGTKKSIEETNKLNEQVQTNLIIRIKEKRARGEDTSRLIGALKTLDSEVNFYDILNTSTGGSLDKSARQVFGEGLGVATDIIGAGALPGKLGQATKAKGFIAGVKQGATTGAISGGIFGTGQGVARAAQDDKTGGEIIGEGIAGGLTGGIAGGVIGGVIGGVSGGIQQRTINKLTKEDNFALDLVSPKATEKVKIQALEEGRVTEQGLLSGSKILPSKRDEKLVEAVKGVVSSKNSPTQNIIALKNKVSEINTGVKAYVRINKVPFNTNQLKTQLNNGKEELNLIFASDKQAEKTYNAVIDEFIKHVKDKDTSGLLDARQAFDNIPAIKKLLESQGLGENVKKEIVLTARTKANEYIASLLPKGNQYRNALLQESRMIETIGNIADKNTGIIGKSKLIELVKEYPILATMLGTGAVTVLGLKGLGVGKSIIGSTD